MKSFQDITSLRENIKALKMQGRTIGFVPTMGALHQGHISLVKESKSNCDITVVSIYVNPTQFNNKEDLDKYPRKTEEDLELLKEAGCDIVFLPQTHDIYNESNDLQIEVGSIGKNLEGKFRPGHFNGVALIVSKLFNIVAPTHAFFGEKDIQQFHVIKNLRDRLNFPINLHKVPTKREDNGLAMSSRNLRLTAREKEVASLIFESLCNARKDLQNGKSINNVKDHISELFLHSEGLILEYFEVVNTSNFEVLDQIEDPEKVVLCMAAEIGNVRLIDNMSLIS